MAAKTEAKEVPAAPAPDKAAPDAAAPAHAASSGGAKGLLKAWLPAVVAILLAPAATFGVAEFVLLPRLQARLALPAKAGDPAAAHAGEAEAAPAEEHAAEKKEGKGEKDTAADYEYTNLVVNLAGTMGTRYLKTSFVITGVNGAATKPVFEGQKAKLTDITLNVLSSLSLADLEEPGSKNVLREKLVATYNQALGKRVVDQVYFSDFVIQ